ncbi:MAG TPA: DUF6766 family protein [Luteolibacter sp.]
MKKFFRDNGLSLALVVLFLVFWLCQALTGLRVYNEDAIRHGDQATRLGAYLKSGHFWQATAENWESEFLQMGAYVLMTSFLFQRGSAESNDPDEPDKEPSAGHSWFYRYSLSLAFLALFLVSFSIHAVEGLRKLNAERSDHGEPAAKLGEYVGGAEFWFESFQNWQSEFLAVLSIVVLTIFLRQQNSPESKKLSSPHSMTGEVTCHGRETDLHA